MGSDAFSTDAPMTFGRRIAFGVAVVVGLLFFARWVYLVWGVDETGFSPMSGKLPTWDFTNLWMGGRLAMTQSVEAVFAPELYRAGLAAMFGPALQPSEWSYPPSILLVGAPLSMLPLYAAYALWTVGGLAALILACRAGGLPLSFCALLALSPAVLLNGVFGQNGAWTAALLIGGLLASEKRPVLAGLLFGLLTMKPHLGVLVPLCLIAAGRWRPVGWSALFSAAVAGLTTALFGVESWRLFLSETRPLMQAILELPFGESMFQVNAITTFMMARALGAPVEPAYAAQALVGVAAGYAAWRLWRAPVADPLLRAAATALLTLLATPYGWSYDAIPLSVAVLALAQRSRAEPAYVLAGLFLWPAIINRVTYYLLPLSPIVLAFAAFICWRAAVRDAPATSDLGEAQPGGLRVVAAG